MRRLMINRCHDGRIDCTLNRRMGIGRWITKETQFIIDVGSERAFSFRFISISAFSEFVCRHQLPYIDSNFLYLLTIVSKNSPSII